MKWPNPYLPPINLWSVPKMKKHTSARGRVIDMAAMAKQHEKERAVSNVPLNARGDIIDSRGQVKVTREKIKEEYYKNTVPGTVEEVSLAEEVEETETPKTRSRSKKKETAVPTEPDIVSQTERTRADGTQYIEIEYADGSMEERDV